jgi:hypothetical protein
MRLAVLATHPVQYFAPVFRELAKQPDLELKVFFGCDHGVKPRKDPNFGVIFQWDCQPTTGFEHEFLSTAPLEGLRGIAGVRLATKAVSAISHYKPDGVLIFSYLPSFITASTLLLRLTNHKLMLRAETTDEALTRSYWKDKLRQFAEWLHKHGYDLAFYDADSRHLRWSEQPWKESDNVLAIARTEREKVIKIINNFNK